MTVEARLADGTILRFPDGTPDDVVDRTVQQHMAQPDRIAPGGIEGLVRRGIGAPPAVNPARAVVQRGLAPLDNLPGPLRNMVADNLSRSNGAALNWLPDAMGLAGRGVGMLGDAVSGGALSRANGFTPEQYQQAVTAELRDRIHQNRQDRPVSAFSNELAGGLVTPGGKAAKAALTPVAQRGLLKAGEMALRSGAVGAVYGGLAGAGEGETAQDKLAGLRSGAKSGAMLGAVAPTAGKVLQAAVPALAAPIRAGVNALADRRAPVPVGAPEGITARTALQGARFVRNVAQTSGKDALALSAADMAGKPITAAEAIGRPGVSHLSALARRAGQTPDIAESFFGERAAQTGDRLLDDISAATGVHPEAARGSIDAIVEAGQKRAAPLFDAALASPDPVINSDLSALTKRPVIRRAISTVAEDILNEGGDPIAYGLSKRVEQVPGGGTRDVWDQVKAPTAQTWDMVKKAVGRQVERNPVTGRPLPDSQSQGNYGVGQASKSLTEALRAHIPGYGDALDASGEYLQVDGAFNRAKGRLFASKTTPKDFSTIVASAKTPAEKAAVQSAIASDLYDRAQNGQLKPGALRIPAVKAKLAAAFGPEKAAEIAKSVEAEAMMSAYGGRIRPGLGSQTGELKAAMAEQDGSSPFAQAAIDAAGDFARTRDPLKVALSAAARQLSHAGATLKAPGMPVPVRDEAGRLLMMSPEELSAYLSTTLRPSRIPQNLGGGLLGRGVSATASRTGG